VGTKAHWTSKPTYKKLPYPAFKQSAEHLAEVAVRQMKREDLAEAKEAAKKREEAKKKKKTAEASAAKKEKPAEASTAAAAKTTMTRSSTSKYNVDVDDPRRPILICYPMKERLGVLFDLGGDIISDRDSNIVELAEDRAQHWVRIPKERTDAARLFLGAGCASAERERWHSDADVASMQHAEIENHMLLCSSSTKVINGSLYELRRDIPFPFPCAPSFFNKTAYTQTRLS
jgi:hypothetical protein